MMLLEGQINTHIQLNSFDSNRYYAIRNIPVPISRNFNESEFFNTRAGLEVNPLAKQIVEISQYVRDRLATPVRINSAYRNYAPSNGTSRSAHMLGQAVDLSFPALSSSERDALLIFIRDDFQSEGQFFQELWAQAVRGFGVYDNRIHLDIMDAEMYDFAKRKRTRKRNGIRYGKWNEMGRLRYATTKSPYTLPTSGTSNETTPTNTTNSIPVLEAQAPAPVDVVSELPTKKTPAFISSETLTSVTNTLKRPFGEIAGLLAAIGGEREDGIEWKKGLFVSGFALLFLVLLFAPIVLLRSTQLQMM